MSDLATTQTRSLAHAFGDSNAYSLGIEEEFQLVDPQSFELVSRAEDIFGHATDGDRLNIKRELMQSVLEIATPICHNTVDAQTELTELRTRVAQLARESNCRFASAGTHPFSRYDRQEITESERYRDLLSRLQWVAQREIIFGLHVHVGIESPAKAMYIFNRIRSFLPQILALSTNSPFWQGRDTGLSSSRSKVFDSFPRSGMPPQFASWEEWETLMRRAMQSNAIDDYTYIWWDVRPHPKFGTIEIRICDAQTRIEDSLALAALIQGTAAWLGSEFEDGAAIPDHPLLLINENKWSAVRYGLDGEFIDLDSDGRVPTREAIGRLFEHARPFANELGSGEAFEHVQTMLKNTGADRQRDWLSEHRSFAKVGELLADESGG